MPVLSVQICEVLPSVSTDASRLTIAPRCGQPAGTHRQRERDHRGQPLRDRGHSEGYRADEQLVELLPADQPQDEHDDDDATGDDRQRPAQGVDLALQRRRPGLRARAAGRAIRPVSVCMPVAVTSTSPRPRVTAVFM